MEIIARIILAMMLLSVVGLVGNVAVSGPGWFVAALGVLAVILSGWTVFLLLFRPGTPESRQRPGDPHQG